MNAFLLGCVTIECSLVIIGIYFQLFTLYHATISISELERLPGPELERLPSSELERLPRSDLVRLHSSDLECLPSSTLERLSSSELERLPSSDRSVYLLLKNNSYLLIWRVIW